MNLPRCTFCRDIIQFDFVTDPTYNREEPDYFHLSCWLHHKDNDAEKTNEPRINGTNG